MSEVMDFYGVWSPDLIELMLPVAIQLEAERNEADFASTIAAVGSVFDKKAADKFLAGIEKVKGAVKESQMRSRGIEPTETPGHTEADKFEAGLRKIGLNVPRGVRRPKPTPKPTEIHEAK